MQGCKRYPSPIGDIYCKKGIGNVKNVHEFTRRLETFITADWYARAYTGGVIKDFNENKPV